MARGKRRLGWDLTSEILAQLENCRPFLPQGTEAVSGIKYHPLRHEDIDAELEQERRSRPRLKMSKAIGAVFIRD